MLRAARFIGLGILAGALLRAGTVAAATNGHGARRIITLGSAVTETVFALGAGSRVVAVDSTSRHPAAARRKPDVGYLRALSTEPLLALRPDIVLAGSDAGPPRVLERLQATGIRVVRLDPAATPEAAVGNVRRIASALQLTVEGERLANDMQARFDALREHRSGLQTRPSVLFLLSHPGAASPIAAGRGTAASAIIALAGGRNAASGFHGYRPIGAEALVRLAPEFLLLTTGSLERLGGREAFLGRPEVQATPAGRARRLAALDSALLTGFGPRTPSAVEKLARWLHPEVRR